MAAAKCRSASTTTVLSGGACATNWPISRSISAARGEYGVPHVQAESWLDALYGSANVRRVAETARLMNDAGLVVVTALISPYREDRAMARAVVGEPRFFLTYLAADVAVCERRDPRGLYAKARSGEIRDFTGVNAPYEVPDDPAIVLETGRDTAQRCVDALYDAVRKLIIA